MSQFRFNKELKLRPHIKVKRTLEEIKFTQGDAALGKQETSSDLVTAGEKEYERCEVLNIYVNTFPLIRPEFDWQGTFASASPIVYTYFK